MRVKKGLRGGRKNAPSPDKKALDAVRPRVPVTFWLTNKPPKTQKRRGPTLRARGAPLALTRAAESGQGRARSPVAHFGEITYSGVKKCSRKTKGEKEKQGQEKHKKTLAASRPKKKASEGPRRIQKTHGAQKGTPRKNAEKQDARPKRAKQKSAAGHKQEKKPEKQVRVRGVLLLPDLCLLKKKPKGRRRRQKNLRKRERTQKKPDLTSIEFFQTVSGAERQKIKQKQ